MQNKMNWKAILAVYMGLFGFTHGSQAYTTNCVQGQQKQNGLEIMLEDSRSESILDSLENARNSYVKYFFDYMQSKDYENAKSNAIESLSTDYFLLEHLLRDYNNNRFFRHAEEFKDRNDNESLEFWQDAAQFYLNMQGLHEFFYKKNLDRLKDEFNGKGFFRKKLMPYDSTGWEFKFNENDINNLRDGFGKLYERLKGLTQYPEFEQGLQNLKFNNLDYKR